MNAGKTKLMVGGGSGGVVSELGAWPCGVCSKGVAANSLQCTACTKLVHMRCSGVKGSRQTVMEEGLVVDGEKCVIVDSFCYLGDMVSTERGADGAMTARVRCAWKKFGELAPFLTSKAPPMRMTGQVYTACNRSCLLYGCKTWAMDAELESKMERTEMRMIRWMCCVSPRERQPSTELTRGLGVETIGDVMKRCRLGWHGHVERKDDADYVNHQ